MGVLILIDEVLMYAREKVAADAKWKDRIVNFFQYLTQAATKVDRCCIVASLLASDPVKSDTVRPPIAGRTLRHLPAPARGGGGTGGEGGCGRSPAAALLHPRIPQGS